jgi:hypothetical protein
MKAGQRPSSARRAAIAGVVFVALGVLFLVDSLIRIDERLWLAMLGASGGVICLAFGAITLWEVWRARSP